MKYPGYFLIVWDFIRYAREKGIPVGPGRGSAAGSLVAYSMRITDVDPIDFDLLFERFLNPERVSLPDIDIDFCERRRGEVIDYVTRKYGRENVAQIITFGTMKAKAVVRDVGRVLEMPFADVDKVAKQIPPTLDMTLDKALEESQALRDLEQNDPKVKELLSVARRLEGMTRHASVHAAGVVIAPQAITEYAPLYKGARDEITTQWSIPRSNGRLASISISTRSRSTIPRPTSFFRTARPTASSSSRAAACATSCARPSRSASTI
jgi:DNA polymerase-3 subunit alpha